MNKLVPSAVRLVFIVGNATAQIQKSPHNRIYIDEDYEYTERARLNRNVREHLEKGSQFYRTGNYSAAADALSRAATLNFLCKAHRRPTRRW